MSKTGASDEVVRAARPPTGVRVVAWLTAITGGWGLLEEFIGAISPESMAWLSLGLSLANLVAGIALIRGQLWGYLATVALWFSSLVWGAWYFFIEGAERETAGPFGFVGIIVMSVPFAFLLSRRAAAWAGNAWRSQSGAPS